MCVLSIKVTIRKKSGKLFNDPRINKLWSRLDLVWQLVKGEDYT